MRALFVCGSGRSGTTVMREALAQHPGTATLPGEFRLVIDPDGILDLHEAFTRAWDPYGTDAAVHRFWRLLDWMESKHQKSYRGHKMDEWCGHAWQDARAELARDLRTAWIPAKWTGAVEGRKGYMFETARGTRAPELRRFVETLYRARNPDATVWVDDTPYTGGHADRIADVFPDRGFVFCVRHPMDIYSSFLHGGKHWTPRVPELAAQRVRETLMNTHATLIGGHRHVEVRLEDVMEAPQAHMRRVCALAGLSDAQEHLDTMAAVYAPARAHMGRWRTELSPDELKTGLRILEPVMDTFGYAT